MNEIFLDEKKAKEFLAAKNELGEETFNKHFRFVFNIPCLDFVKTIVINLPESCYANCEYCIDNNLKRNTIDTISFLEICEKVLKEFPDTMEVSITGGSLKAKDFNMLVKMIKKYLPTARLTWNTNGILIDDEYKEGISQFDYINLHRNSIDDNENIKVFKTNKPILTIPEAKNLMGNSLCLRITVDENFNIDEYVTAGVPIYINRLLPGTEKSDKVFNETLKKLNISDNIDVRRRNKYLICNYNGISVRVCMGDKLSTHIPNRYPTYLNVAIIHRSGLVCGSWYEDDKLIYSPVKEMINK